MSSNPGRIPPAIHNWEDGDLRGRFGVINRERKGLAQQTVIICVIDPVYPGSYFQALNVRFYGT